MSAVLQKFVGSPTVRTLLLTLPFVILAIFWVQGSGFRQDLGVLTSTYALLALGMYVPFIMGDRLSLAYNAYLSIGAYAAAMLGTRTDLSMLWAYPIGMVLAAAVAVALGFVTRQLSGFFLAAVTLLFGVAFGRFLIDAGGITGGPDGIRGLPTLELFGVAVSRTWLVVGSILSVWVVGLLLGQLRRSTFGMAVRAQGEIPVAVEATGIRVPALALITLGMGAAIASIGGTTFAIANKSILPETFTLSIVFLAVFMPVLGGRQTPWGAVLGAVLVTYFTFGIQMVEGTGNLLFALAVLFVILIAPNGLLGFVGRSLRQVQDQLGRRA